MSEKAFILSADSWEITDKNTGQVLKGVSCHYVNQYRDGDNGQKPTKVSITPEVALSLKGKLPCVADLEFGSRPGAGGKAALTVVSVKILRVVDLAELFDSV